MATAAGNVPRQTKLSIHCQVIRTGWQGQGRRSHFATRGGNLVAIFARGCGKVPPRIHRAGWRGGARPERPEWRACSASQIQARATSETGKPASNGGRAVYSGCASAVDRPGTSARWANPAMMVRVAAFMAFLAVFLAILASPGRSGRREETVRRELRWRNLRRCPLRAAAGAAVGESNESIETVPSVGFAGGATTIAPPGGACGPAARCPNGQCCSQYGWCGTTDGHCGPGCNSTYGQCTLPGASGSICASAPILQAQAAAAGGALAREPPVA
jgi:hypothetical protein